jgi:GTP cyclohydrolase I
MKELKDPKLLELAKYIKHVFTELGIYDNIPEYMEEHIEDTPYRIVKAWREFVSSLNYELPVTSFTNPVNELVYVTDITFNSLCCHHFFPFNGKAHVAYLPKEKLLGLSKIPRIVRHFAKRPQIQEVMTSEIADYIFEKIEPEFLMIICKANHTCCSGRGVESFSPMIVSSIRHSEELSDSDRKSLKKEVLDTISMKDRLL